MIPGGGFGRGLLPASDERPAMQIEATALAGVMILTPQRFGDARGFFSESWNKARLAGLGIEMEFVQDNHSLSGDVNTVRGLHFQAPPHAQDKLVRCGRGCLYDVAVDIRVGSPTYGAWVGVELSAENGRQLLIPKGFLHGFATRVPDTEIIYKCTDVYNPKDEHGVLWSDHELNIDWPVKNPILSDKDKTFSMLSQMDKNCLPVYTA